ALLEAGRRLEGCTRHCSGPADAGTTSAPGQRRDLTRVRSIRVAACLPLLLGSSLHAESRMSPTFTPGFAHRLYARYDYARMQPAGTAGSPVSLLRAWGFRWCASLV